MNAKTVSLLILCCALTGCGKRSPYHDVAKLEGQWTVVQLHEKGKASDAEAMKRLNVTIAQGKFQKVEVDADRLVQADESAIQMNPTKTPAEIDFVYLQGDDQGKSRPGIFALEGDKLKICVGDVGGSRPTDFVAQGNANLIVLERKK